MCNQKDTHLNILWMYGDMFWKGVCMEVCMYLCIEVSIHNFTRNLEFEEDELTSMRET